MRSYVCVTLCVLILSACGKVQHPEYSRIVHSGDVVVISHGLRTSIPVALHKRDAHDLARAVEIADESAVRQMVDSGRAVLIPSKARVRVTAESYNERRVEALDGKEAGKGGWVPYEWLAVAAM